MELPWDNFPSPTQLSYLLSPSLMRTHIIMSFVSYYSRVDLYTHISNCVNTFKPHDSFFSFRRDMNKRKHATSTPTTTQHFILYHLTIFALCATGRHSCKASKFLSSSFFLTDPSTLLAK